MTMRAGDSVYTYAEILHVKNHVISLCRRRWC